MMVINNKFELGSTVYLKTDTEQKPALMIGFLVTPVGLQYRVAMGTSDTYHYECELSIEKNIQLKVNS